MLRCLFTICVPKARLLLFSFYQMLLRTLKQFVCSASPGFPAKWCCGVCLKK